jgi:hypothetical protein
MLMVSLGPGCLNGLADMVLIPSVVPAAAMPDLAMNFLREMEAGFMVIVFCFIEER